MGNTPGFPLVKLLLAAALLVGCGNLTAAPVNVEATVQARVTGTVGAVTRAQSTPTRPPLGPTAAIGTVAATPSPFGIATSTVSGLPGTATRLAGSAIPGGTPGTATRAPGPTTPGTTPGGTPGVSVTPTVFGTPTSGGTASANVTPSSAPLALGNFARFAGYSLTVARYEWGSACPNGGRTFPGVKFVTLQAAARNDLATALALPGVQWSLEGRPAGSASQPPCQGEGPSFSDACLRAGQLPAGARCDGWLLFEVPESMDVPGALAQARVTGAGAADTVFWRLPSA